MIASAHRVIIAYAFAAVAAADFDDGVSLLQMRATSDNASSDTTFIPAHIPYVDNMDFPETLPDEGADRTHDGVTMLRHVPAWMPIMGPQYSKKWANRLLVWPEHKFAFCYIAKNAGTEFNILMNHLNGIKTTGDTKHTPWMQTSVERQPHLSYSDITKKNGWRTAIFVRSPEERFLSAWLSKCNQWEDGGINCLGGKHLVNNLVAHFEGMVRTQLGEYMKASHQSVSYNSHYDPQSGFCGARSLNTYDFVGHLTGDFAHVHSQVVTMLQSVAKVPDDSSVWEFLPSVFPKQQPEGHHTGASHRLSDYYRSQDVHAKVVAAYAEDYHKIGFKKGQYK